MMRKLILGAAAVVALSAAVMSPSTAEAKWKKHHHFHSHGYGKVFYGAYGMGGYGYGGGGCFVKRWVPTPYGMRLRVVNRCAW